MEKLIRNAKINRVTFLVTGIIFMFFGFFEIFFFGVGGVLLVMAYLTNKKHKKLLEEYNKPDPVPVCDPVIEVDTNKVKITELNGNVIEVNSYMKLDDDSIVLITPNSKKYHTCVGCFKHWRPEMQNDFTGWTVMKKDDAINNGMTYCNFCDENDKYTLDDLLDDLENEEELN